MLHVSAYSGTAYTLHGSIPPAQLQPKENTEAVYALRAFLVGAAATLAATNSRTVHARLWH